MQCDRHGQNAFVNEQGRLTLIDLDQALGEGWRVCGQDSLFLPTTQKFVINTLGYQYVMKFGGRPRGTVGLQVRFDYRCHVAGGTIGKQFPPKVQQCLSDISKMELAEVRLRCAGALQICCVL